MDFTALVGETLSSGTSVYKVQKLLDRGTFGVVTLCTNTTTQERAAIKFVMDRRQNWCAKLEAQLLRDLTAWGSEQHSIVRFLGGFSFRGFFCLEFEHLDVNLHAFCRPHGLQLREIRPIARQLADALCFLEDKQIVHTDLKTPNVMLVNRVNLPLRIKVIDFGSALVLPLRKGGEFQTLWYRSPEVVVRGSIGLPMDMWSLGCILAELLTGATLFPVRDELSLLHLMRSTIGKIPERVLDEGDGTRKFFIHAKYRLPRMWKLKSPRCFSGMRAIMPLDALLKTRPPTPPRDAAAAARDLYAFRTLVRRMLHLDPLRRIRPLDSLRHPFMTLTHLEDGDSCSYLQDSAELLRVCGGGDHPATHHRAARGSAGP